MFRIIFPCFATLGLLVAGCATSSVPTSERRPVATDRVFAPGLLSPSSERTARFILVRDRGSAGVLAGVNVFIDGQKIARLAAAETVTIFASPGMHTLAARFSYGPVGPAERAFEADPKKPLTVRVYTEGSSSSLDLRPETGYSY